MKLLPPNLVYGQQHETVTALPIEKRMGFEELAAMLFYTTACIPFTRIGWPAKRCGVNDGSSHYRGPKDT